VIEKQVWPVLFASKPAGVAAHRIETGRTSLGVPDVLFFDGAKVGWIENKTAYRNTRGTLVLREPLSPAQADFLLVAHDARCISVIAVWWHEQQDERLHFALVRGADAMEFRISGVACAVAGGSRPHGVAAGRVVWELVRAQPHRT